MADTYYAVMRHVAKRHQDGFASAFRFPMPPTKNLPKKSLHSMAGNPVTIDKLLRAEGWEKTSESGPVRFAGEDVMHEIWTKNA